MSSYKNRSCYNSQFFIKEFIDKEKLISLSLSLIMNFSILKILINNENDNKVFKDIK